MCSTSGLAKDSYKGPASQCIYETTLVPDQDADWGGYVHQPINLAVLAKPEIVRLYPEAGDSTQEHV